MSEAIVIAPNLSKNSCVRCRCAGLIIRQMPAVPARENTLGPMKRPAE